MTSPSPSQRIFDRLWHDYTLYNPEVKRIYDSFTETGEKVINDHIAFRTFNDPRVNIDVLSRPFIRSGYVLKGTYTFEKKHLFARHFEDESSVDAPRVFISELILEEFSEFTQKTAKQVIDQIPRDLLTSDELIYSGNVWGKPSFEIYEKLRTESEYAAWVYVYGFCANHFTVSVNGLKNLNTLEKVNDFLKAKGFLLNTAEGEIKGTPQELLEQSSTRAGIIEVEFSEGRFSIPSCYYEFARRYPDRDGRLYSGFIAKSADKIFESTDFYRK
ncbi:MAG TPA: DUF1338 domain-containing protein [Bacteroidales bacterium]|nr:DUF1338 domain-containing protein [Bacteroidales bacterium]HRZ20802.1 DUF1338 domain-containing protein [Bacteroidales bacterium]